MSATDELRRLLDDRGVEYEGETDEDGWAFTRWHGFDNTGWLAASDELCGLLDLRGRYLFTPEQAIAATLGSGTCSNVSQVMDEHGQARFACSECGAWIDSRMLWNPEYRNGESPWVSDCKLNYCPNCGRRVVGE